MGSPFRRGITELSVAMGIASKFRNHKIIPGQFSGSAEARGVYAQLGGDLTIYPLRAVGRPA